MSLPIIPSPSMAPAQIDQPDWLATVPPHLKKGMVESVMADAADESRTAHPELSPHEQKRAGEREAARAALRLLTVNKHFKSVVDEVLAQHPELQLAIEKAEEEAADSTNKALEKYAAEETNTSGNVRKFVGMDNEFTLKAMQHFKSRSRIIVDASRLSVSKFDDVVSALDNIANDPSKNDLTGIVIDCSKLTRTRDKFDDLDYAALARLLAVLPKLSRTNRKLRIHLNLSRLILDISRREKHEAKAIGEQYFNPRGMDAAQVVKSLAKALEHRIPVTNLDLSLNGLDYGWECGFARDLRKHDVMPETGMTVLAPYLDRCTELKSLNLSANWMNDEDVHMLAQHFPPDLTHFDAGYTGLNDYKFNCLSQALIGSKSLTHLDLNSNNLGKSPHLIAKTISKLPSLKALNLHQVFLNNPNCIRHIAPALPASLESLDLSRNVMNEADAVMLAQALAKSTSLTSLNLSDVRAWRWPFEPDLPGDKLRDVDIMTPIALALPASLKHLDLRNSCTVRNNRYRFEGGHDLLLALSRMPSLTSLNLQESIITDGFVDDLVAHVLPNAKSLRSLNLAGESPLHDKESGLSSKSIQKLVPCLMQLTSLTHLAVSTDTLDEQALAALGELQQANLGLTITNWDGLPFNP